MAPGPAPAGQRGERWVAAVLLAAGAIAWAGALRVPSSGGTHPAAFVALWTLMMVAMMAPSVLPTVLVFATSTAPGMPVSPARTGLFVLGYFVAWAALGAVVALGRWALWPALIPWTRPASATALVLAGGYQMTPWKQRCLSHCRTPLHFLMQHWRAGAGGALVMGAHHGLYCVGCCLGLMATLVALGMMSPLWMVSIAVVVLLEKVVPCGDRLALAVGFGIVVLGLGVALGWQPPGLGMEGM